MKSFGLRYSDFVWHFSFVIPHSLLPLLEIFGFGSDSSRTTDFSSYNQNESLAAPVTLCFVIPSSLVIRASSFLSRSAHSGNFRQAQHPVENFFTRRVFDLIDCDRVCHFE